MHVLVFIVLGSVLATTANAGVVLNSNLMIPDFPHNIRIRLAPRILIFSVAMGAKPSFYMKFILPKPLQKLTK